MQMYKNTLIEYVKTKKGLTGCLIATKSNDIIYIGWSKYASSIEYNNFSKNKGLLIADQRMEKRKSLLHKEYKTREINQLPFDIQKNIEKFIKRCRLYFKVDFFIIA